MATYFGEILPIQSRAVDDDDDFEAEEAPPCSTIIRWSPVAKELMQKETKDFTKKGIVIISIGEGATGFMKAYVMDNKECEILGVACSGMSDDDVSSFEQTSYTDKTCYIYRLMLKPHVIIVQCQANVTEQYCHSWTTKIFEDIPKLLNMTEHSSFLVHVLHNSPFEHYKSQKLRTDSYRALLRCLHTKEFTEGVCAPLLEIPNTIVGLPAQVLTHCELAGIPGVLYESFTESSHFSSDFIKVFRPILQTAALIDSVRENPYGDKVAKELSRKLQQFNSLFV